MLHACDGPDIGVGASQTPDCDDTTLLMNPPNEVLQQYPPFDRRDVRYLGNRGGFSGAQLWRIDADAGPFCLKAWPTDDLSLVQLACIHRRLTSARRAGIEFVPQPLPTRAGVSVVVHAGRMWDVCTWLPGVADFHVLPSSARLAAAGTAIARLHLAWSKVESRLGPSPVVERRLNTLRRWRELLVTGWQPDIEANDPVRVWAERAWQLLPHAVPAAERSLMAWREVPLPLHPVWSDPWHDHVLFTGERVTGLIDYGSVKEDHAAIDIARLLGSFVGDDQHAWQVFLTAYRALRPLTDQECVFIAVLEQASLVNAVVTWLRWLYVDRRTFENRAAIADRLRIMVQRLGGTP